MGSSQRRVKPKTLKLELVTGPLCTQHYVKRAKTGWLGIKIMWGDMSTVECGFSELAL